MYDNSYVIHGITFFCEIPKFICKSNLILLREAVKDN